MKSSAPILLIEDDKVDQISVKRAMKDAEVTNELLIAQHGEAAFDILNHHPRPSLILLDLNMPKMNGLEFLQKIKSIEEINAVPVLIITTSNAAEERLAAFRMGACGFMIKPVEYPDFVRMFSIINSYWTLSETPF
jgi:CheY-like chemotaxis protein